MNAITSLNKILKKGTMSPRLQEAVKAILKALQEKDMELAYQLSVVKSFITGSLNPKDRVHAFQEDSKKNKDVLTVSIYSILDTIHHDIASTIGRMPSGMMAVSRSGVAQMISEGTHPIIERIKYERAQNAKRF